MNKTIHGTQKQRIMRLLIDNRQFTRNEARWVHRIIEVAARISELRRDGIKILGAEQPDGYYMYYISKETQQTIYEIDNAVTVIKKHGLKVVA